MSPRLTSLKVKHSTLEDSIRDLENAPCADTLALSSLKRDKLRIKEEMTLLETAEQA